MAVAAVEFFVSLERPAYSQRIRILLNWTWVWTLWLKFNLEGFVWSHQSITGLISQRKFAPQYYFLASRPLGCSSFRISWQIPQCHKFNFLWSHVHFRAVLADSIKSWGSCTTFTSLKLYILLITLHKRKKYSKGGKVQPKTLLSYQTCKEFNTNQTKTESYELCDQHSKKRRKCTLSVHN